MGFFRKFIASTYGLRMKLSKITGMGINVIENTSNKNAPVDFFSLKAVTIAGEKISFEKYRGKKVLLVNLASQCGYTPQYAELEKLNEQNNDLVILGFPSNNFGGQEPGTNKEIENFCTINYGVTFQLFEKDDVAGKSRQRVYKWLSDEKQNGWNNLEPQWNFYKYLIDESGRLSKVFSSSISPLDTRITS